MGVDVHAIMGHKLSAQEVLDLPWKLRKYHKPIDTCQELGAYMTQRFNGYYKCDWDWAYHYDNSVEYIQQLWADEEAGDYGMPTNLEASFGLIYIHRKTIEISFLSKYSFFANDLKAQDLMLEIGRLIAEFFAQDRVIFFPDSLVEQQLISQPNRTIEQIEEWANEKFGAPDKDRQTAIQNYYHIERL